jgi:hypothetical protein
MMALAAIRLFSGSDGRYAREMQVSNGGTSANSGQDALAMEARLQTLVKMPISDRCFVWRAGYLEDPYHRNGVTSTQRVHRDINARG